jgi:dTDP-4-dehydrorhamnose 3,5-epimerase-like enzyme
VSRLSDCQPIEFGVIPNPAGDLTTIDAAGDLPFPIRRVYYVYSVPEGAQRGGHAHRRLEQVLIAIAGSFDVVIDDGERRETVRLDTPGTGLYLPTMVWRELTNFTAAAVCLVLASEPYDEADYVRDYDEFRSIGARD